MCLIYMKPLLEFAKGMFTQKKDLQFWYFASHFVCIKVLKPLLDAFGEKIGVNLEFVDSKMLIDIFFDRFAVQ